MSKTATLILHFTTHRAKVKVTNFKEASTIMRECIVENGYGASDMRGKCGDVMLDGIRIGIISYNGRAWVQEYPSPEIIGDDLTKQFT